MSPIYKTVELLALENKKQVKYLPKHIGKKFPNLLEINGFDCELTVLRNHYFTGLKKLQFLHLMRNKISLIDFNAFDDLISVEMLNLDGNMIRTLDRNFFASMVNLKEIHLKNNKIEFSKPTTFRIPKNEKLFYVDLRENVCIDAFFRDNMAKVETELRAQCNSRAPLGRRVDTT